MAKGSLQEAMDRKAAGPSTKAASSETPARRRRSKRSRAANTDKPQSAARPDRADKRSIAAFFPPEVRTQLKMLTVENDTTLQALMGEAFNDLFAKYGKPEIAPVPARE